MENHLLLCENGENITISQCKQGNLVIDGNDFCVSCTNLFVKTVYDRRISPRFKTLILTCLSEYPPDKDGIKLQYIGTTIDISVNGIRVELLSGFNRFNNNDMVCIDMFPSQFNKKLPFTGEIVYMIADNTSKGSGILGIKFIPLCAFKTIESLITGVSNKNLSYAL